MNQDIQIVLQHLREQIALEEHLCKVIQDQLLAIDPSPIFFDATQVLESTSSMLEQHFRPLNDVLMKLEKEFPEIPSSNGVSAPQPYQPGSAVRISRFLRDDYSSLNVITMSNALLHTIALALESKEVARMALQHLENLAPLVVKLGRLVPEIAARELRASCPTVASNVGSTAVKNMERAWKKAA